MNTPVIPWKCPACGSGKMTCPCRLKPKTDSRTSAMSTTTPTPRTEAQAISWPKYPLECSFYDAKTGTITDTTPKPWVSADFARTLETELAASHAREVMLREALKQISCEDIFDVTMREIADAALTDAPPPPVITVEEAVKRIEGVDVEELGAIYMTGGAGHYTDKGLQAIRARLIQALRG